MNKWDGISWWATGIVAGALLAALLTQSDAWLLLMVGAYFLRPTLYALGIATRSADERQMLIQYRSGNLALTILLLGIIVFIVKNRLEGRPADEFHVLLVLGLAARALTGVILTGALRRAAFVICIAVGGFWLLFVVASHGVGTTALLESLPAFFILGAALVGRRWPMAAALVIFVASVALFYGIAFRAGQGFTIFQVFTASLVSIPLLTAAASFFRTGRRPADEAHVTDAATGRP